jgi:adenine deaminase
VGTDYAAAGRSTWQGRLCLPRLYRRTRAYRVVDGHSPPQFARAVVPRGTTAVVADPHEIANVAGLDGFRYMLAVSEGLPLTVYLAAPSCVPATHMGTAGAALAADDLATLADLPRVVGLAEFMNVPGLVLGFPDVLAKVKTFAGRVIDGHAPGLSGKWLQAYVGAGPGSDHESSTAAEMVEKLRAGMVVLIREATAARNLHALLPAVTSQNSRRCAFCSDDRHPADLLDEGHLDHLLRLAVAPKGWIRSPPSRWPPSTSPNGSACTTRGAIAPVDGPTCWCSPTCATSAGDGLLRRTAGGPPGQNRSEAWPTPGCGRSAGARHGARGLGAR